MTPEEWGPPIWTLFHCLAEKMREESFPMVGRPLFGHIYKIVSFLPCPECSQHAKSFLAKINPGTLKNKADFKNTLYVFHNAVNKRKKKPMFNNERLDIHYANRNLIHVMNRFMYVYNTNGNMNLINDSFHRKFVVSSFKKWMIANAKHFSI
jgi:hypothetical protein